MEHYLHIIVELLFTILLFSTLVLIFMELFNRVIAMFASKESTIQSKDAEIQRLNELNASLEAQLSTQNSGTQELSNFLSERGF